MAIIKINLKLLMIRKTIVFNLVKIFINYKIKFTLNINSLLGFLNLSKKDGILMVINSIYLSKKYNGFLKLLKHFLKKILKLSQS